MIRSYTFWLILSCFSACALFGQNKSFPVSSIRSGLLSDSVYTQVKTYLSTFSSNPLKDTIIIKYDYNRESCWNMLDKQNDTYIRNVIFQQQQRIQRTLMARPGISIFTFREAGNKINKLKKWDQTILIDQLGNLRKLLFAKKQVCGNSIILLPDRRFVYFEVDPHFEALDHTGNAIQ